MRASLLVLVLVRTLVVHEISTLLSSRARQDGEPRMRHNFLPSLYFMYALPHTCLVRHPSPLIGLTARLICAVRHARIVTRLAKLTSSSTARCGLQGAPL
ncbi:hypothetical protein B0H21DRAFT_734414, partial [Amylocystis lapponica]